jgi:hypothetical protein
LNGGKKQASGQVSQVKRFFEIQKLGTELRNEHRVREESNIYQPH